MHEWRNWNTRQTKDLVSAHGACGFESHLVYHPVSQWSYVPFRIGEGGLQRSGAR